MKILLTIVIAAFIATFASCDVQSGISKKSVEEYQPTPLPSVVPTPEEPPIDPVDVVQVDTSLQGDIISVNKPGEKKTIACDKYNQVMVNRSDTVVTVTGGCRQLMLNGNNNDVTIEAVMAVVFNGEGNKVKYTKYGNGKRPSITQNKSGNTIEKIAAPAKK
jgi:Protein of unknown function (DUF3060).